MRIVPITSIVVDPNRQRQEFDPAHQGELMASIERVGLMHPLVVRENGAFLHLVAGECRLKCISDMAALGSTFDCNGEPVDLGLVPVVTLGELDPLEAMEAELDENIKRRDLTWQERAQAMTKLEALRAGQGKPSTPAALAEEVHGKSAGWYQDNAKQQLIVARHLDDPDVARAKTLGEATKIVRKKDEAQRNERLAASVGSTFSALSHTFRQGDSLEVMKDLAPESFDVILTDPPYGIDADQFGDAAGKLVALTHNYSDSADSFQQLLSAAIPAFTRLAKPAAHAYLFCDIDGFAWLRATMASSGWTVFRTPLVLVKANSGRVPLPDHGPRRQYELILYAFRGKRPINFIAPDVLTVQGDDNLGHGAQKPVAAYVDLLRRSVHPGERVLDLFAGTGTIFPAAHQLLCSATGIEREPQNAGICVTRLAGLK